MIIGRRMWQLRLLKAFSSDLDLVHCVLGSIKIKSNVYFLEI